LKGVPDYQKIMNMERQVHMKKCGTLGIVLLAAAIFAGG
jgi:hypothetical protein